MSSVERELEAFQVGLTSRQVEAVCRRGLGEDAPLLRAVELSGGTYNTTYRIDLVDRPGVVLRVAPDDGHQNTTDRHAMRNEYAAAPYLAGLGSLVPSVLAADFTHQVIDRDFMFQTLLPGVAASDGLERYPRAQWAEFYQQLGGIARQIHAVEGPAFGYVAGPFFASWSDALVSSYADAATELTEAGLDPSQVRRIANCASSDHALLDAVEPRLLHGDLWHVNILIDPDADKPIITGVHDSDRASWGDPLADWTVDRAQQRPGTERDAFWTTYGALPSDAATRRRLLYYRARNLVGGRLDIHRRGLDLSGIPPEHWDLAPVLAELLS